MKEYTIKAEDDGIRLDRWFKRHFPAVTHGMLEKHLRKGAVKLNQKKAKSSDRVSEGQKIEVHGDELAKAAATPLPGKAPSKFEPTEHEIKDLKQSVLHKDARLLVINKPPGLAVQGGSKIEKNLDDMLTHLRFDKAEKPRLVHRLDKDTSGVLMLARDARTAAILSKRLQRKDVQKFYWALVKGVPEIRRGKIDLPMAKREQGEDSRMEKVEIDNDAGKDAITRYQVLETLGDQMCWVELEPVTGRTHQLRVHMAAIGHPIVGDGKYGGRDAFVRGIELSRQLHLHARRIELPEWEDGETLIVEAPLPAHMRKSFDELGLDYK